MNKYQTSRIPASRVRVGTVLYHGGTVHSVERMADGRIVIVCGSRRFVEPATRRLTYYPNL